MLDIKMIALLIRIKLQNKNKNKNYKDLYELNRGYV